MDLKWLICTTIIVYINIKQSSSSCEIIYPNDHRTLPRISCNYTVTCKTRPEGVSNPSCSVESFVTFIIKNAENLELTTGFFASTNFDSRVRFIQATSNAWTTLDTSAFRYYSKCIRLDLSNNEIILIKNESFRNLYNLKSLNLSHNQITTMNVNSFLIADSRTNMVQELDLSHNQLKELKAELNELPNLQILYLQNNKLNSLADDVFMNLKNLSILYLQNNRLETLNLTLTNLKKLVSLDLSNNNLIKLSGFELNRLVSLVNANFSHNALSFIESNCFNQAFSLKSLDFSYNNIKMIIDNIIFINNNALEYLNFYNNHINGLQDNFLKHCAIKNINLNINNISGDITENTFSGVRLISTLDLIKQNITGIRNNAFADMENLMYLNLSKNSIKYIGISSFLYVPLKILDISYNNITDLNFLKDCLVNLTHIFLNNNNIEVIPENTFLNQTNVSILDLSMNKIIQIKEHSLPLYKLQFLYINGNRLNGTIEKNIFSPARYLRFLDLSNFSISKIGDMAFVGLPVLARLNLSHNQIEDIKPNNFEGVYNMYSLDISNNKLGDLKLNPTILKAVKAMYLNNNNLSNISKIFTSKFGLIYLDASYNNISVFDIGFETIPNLTTLYLTHNRIKQFNNVKVNSLSTLRDLRLSYNTLSNIKLNCFKELMSLDLSNVSLAYINSTFLHNVEYLQALDISKNNLKDLPPGTFQYMKNLKLVNLSSNFLTKLRYGSLKGLHKTEVLDLSNNYISSLEVDLFHECSELTILIIDYNRIKTFNVDRMLYTLPKIKTLSLGGNPISCKEIVLNMKSTNVSIYTMRRLEVTSIDKVYHEDNVHGIKCGDNDNISIIKSTIKPNSELSKTENASAMSFSIVLILCAVLTIMFIATGVIIYIKFYKKTFLMPNENSRNVMQLDNSDFQSDLLS